ncbi:MAG: hypothetical protein HZA53_15345 [Planctomycetes bacterium]|nr:hypothetical protein [Planctomycetota bacterium]
MPNARRPHPLGFLAAALVVGAGAAYFALDAREAPGSDTARAAGAPEPARAPEPALIAPPAPEALARTNDDLRLAALDHVDPVVPFEEKYAGFEAPLLVKARARVDTTLADASETVFAALFATGKVQKIQTPPGEEDPASEGSTARKARTLWQPYGITEKEIAEFDLAEHPDTRGLWAERRWLDEHLPSER